MRVKRRHIPEFDAHLFVCSTISSQVAVMAYTAQVVVEDYVAVAAREVAHYAALRPHVVVSAFLVAVVVVRAQDCTSVCKSIFAMKTKKARVSYSRLIKSIRRPSRGGRFL